MILRKPHVCSLLLTDEVWAKNSHIPTKIAETAVFIRWGEGHAFMDDSIVFSGNVLSLPVGGSGQRSYWIPGSYVTSNSIKVIPI